MEIANNFNFKWSSCQIHGTISFVCEANCIASKMKNANLFLPSSLIRSFSSMKSNNCLHCMLEQWFLLLIFLIFLYVQYVKMGNDTSRTITRAKTIVNAASAVSSYTLITILGRDRTFLVISVTSVRTVIFYSASVFLFVCLSVCLLATLRKRTTDWIFIKILPEMYLW